MRHLVASQGRRERRQFRERSGVLWLDRECVESIRMIAEEFKELD